MDTINLNSGSLRTDLSNLLKANEAKVTFTKRDGTERVMKCTLVPEAYESYGYASEENARVPNLDVLPVWDLEANGWRSIVLDNILLIEVVQNGN